MFMIFRCTQCYFSLKSSGTHSDSTFGRRGGGVSCTDARGKRFQNTVPVFVLLGMHLRNGVPARSVTKILLAVPNYICLKCNDS
jgi:hypothetical protein